MIFLWVGIGIIVYMAVGVFLLEALGIKAVNALAGAIMIYVWPAIVIPAIICIGVGYVKTMRLRKM